MTITPAQKMGIIQKIFRDVQDNFPDSYTLQTLAEKLDSYEIEFRSIAYEAASFCIGLKDLEAENNLNSWKKFLNEIGKPHATQIHVGLGWVFAQKQIDPTPFLSQLEPMMRYRVLDGYGYYEGIFRRRRSILGQQKFETNDEVASGAYDQGLGRSLWYSNIGKIEEVKAAIDRIPVERRKDLWRGLGIAIAYVGGGNEEVLREIWKITGEYKSQLATGAVMAVISRHNAHYIPVDTEVISQIWLNKDTDSVIGRYHSQKVNLNPDTPFLQWVSEIERDF